MSHRHGDLVCDLCGATTTAKGARFDNVGGFVRHRRGHVRSAIAAGIGWTICPVPSCGAEIPAHGAHPIWTNNHFRILHGQLARVDATLMSSQPPGRLGGLAGAAAGAPAQAARHRQSLNEFGRIGGLKRQRGWDTSATSESDIHHDDDHDDATGIAAAAARPGARSESDRESDSPGASGGLSYGDPSDHDTGAAAGNGQSESDSEPDPQHTLVLGDSSSEDEPEDAHGLGSSSDEDSGTRDAVDGSPAGPGPGHDDLEHDDRDFDFDWCAEQVIGTSVQRIQREAFAERCQATLRRLAPLPQVHTASADGAGGGTHQVRGARKEWEKDLHDWAEEAVIGPKTFDSLVQIYRKHHPETKATTHPRHLRSMRSLDRAQDREMMAARKGISSVVCVECDMSWACPVLQRRIDIPLFDPIDAASTLIATLDKSSFPSPASPSGAASAGAIGHEGLEDNCDVTDRRLLRNSPLWKLLHGSAGDAPFLLFSDEVLAAPLRGRGGTKMHAVMLASLASRDRPKTPRPVGVNSRTRAYEPGQSAPVAFIPDMNRMFNRERARGPNRPNSFFSPEFYTATKGQQTEWRQLLGDAIVMEVHRLVLEAFAQVHTAAANGGQLPGGLPVKLWGGGDVRIRPVIAAFVGDMPEKCHAIGLKQLVSSCCPVCELTSSESLGDTSSPFAPSWRDAIRDGAALIQAETSDAQRREMARKGYRVPSRCCQFNPRLADGTVIPRSPWTDPRFEGVVPAMKFFPQTFLGSVFFTEEMHDIGGGNLVYVWEQMKRYLLRLSPHGAVESTKQTFEDLLRQLPEVWSHDATRRVFGSSGAAGLATRKERLFELPLTDHSATKVLVCDHLMLVASGCFKKLAPTAKGPQQQQWQARAKLALEHLSAIKKMVDWCTAVDIHPRPITAEEIDQHADRAVTDGLLAMKAIFAAGASQSCNYPKFHAMRHYPHLLRKLGCSSAVSASPFEKALRYYAREVFQRGDKQTNELQWLVRAHKRYRMAHQRLVCRPYCLEEDFHAELSPVPSSGPSATLPIHGHCTLSRGVTLTEAMAGGMFRGFRLDPSSRGDEDVGENIKACIKQGLQIIASAGQTDPSGLSDLASEFLTSTCYDDLRFYDEYRMVLRSCPDFTHRTSTLLRGASHPGADHKELTCTIRGAFSPGSDSEDEASLEPPSPAPPEPFSHPRLLQLPGPALNRDAVWPVTVFGWLRLKTQRDTDRRAFLLFGYWESSNDHLPGGPPPLCPQLEQWGIRVVFRHRTKPFAKYKLAVASARSVIARAPMFRDLLRFGPAFSQTSLKVPRNYETYGWFSGAAEAVLDLGPGS